MIVIDTNILVYYCTPAPQQSAALALKRRDADWHAPGLWRSEFRSVLAGDMRRRGMSASAALRTFAHAERAVYQTHEVNTNRVLQLVANSRCTAYDLEYVALAQQLQAKLITMDRELLREFPEIAQPLPD